MILYKHAFLFLAQLVVQHGTVLGIFALIAELGVHGDTVPDPGLQPALGSLVSRRSRARLRLSGTSSDEHQQAWVIISRTA